MKNLLMLAIAAAAAYYAYTSWPPGPRDIVAERSAAARSYGGNPVSEIERAPDALIETRNAMASQNANTANAARSAVSQVIGR